MAASRRYVAAAAIVAAGSLVAEVLYLIFRTTRLSAVFLAAVLIAAVTLGARAALFAAVLAFLIYNFYLVDPRFSFTLATPEDYLTLTLFLAVAIMTGGLAGRVRDEALRSQARATTTNALFQASRELSSTLEEDALRQRLVELMALAAKGEAFLTDGARTWVSTPAVRPPGLDAADLAALSTRPEAPAIEAVSRDRWRLKPLMADGQPIGLAGWRRGESKPQDDADGLLQVLVDIGGAAIARAQLGVVKAEAEALAKTEKLQTALLSSISHDLRTPLTAILVSVSSLREFGRRLEPDVRDDLLLNIEEETERLNRFVANLLTLTRLEGGVLALKPVSLDVREVIDGAGRRFEKRLAGKTLRIKSLTAGPLIVRGDPVLLEQAIANVMENAIRFAPDRSAVTIEAQRCDERVDIRIADEGPGVPPEEFQRIFDKFYRAQTSAPLQQGAGLGLSITRGLVESMNGSIEARGRRDGRSGLEVAIRLPAERLDG